MKNIKFMISHDFYIFLGKLNEKIPKKGRYVIVTWIVFISFTYFIINLLISFSHFDKLLKPPYLRASTYECNE